MTLTTELSGPNYSEIEFWNGPQGMNWVKQVDLTDLMYDPFGARAMERAALNDGDRVLDVRCGCGTTTAKLADAVAPLGSVTAIDVSAPMLKVAKQRNASNAGRVKFIGADAASYNFESASYNVLFSQFGLMFFLNPEHAFANLFRALKTGGRLSFVSWRLPELNPFLMVPFAAVQSFVPDMPVPSPDSPASPFSLAREERIRELLEGTGFVNVELEVFDYPTRMGCGDLDACVGFVADFSNPVATALRRADKSMAPKILDAVRSAVAPYFTDDTLELPASAWIVTAKRP